MTTDRDPRTRIVLSWLSEETHENAERVLLRALDEVDTTPQRRSPWPAWRTNRMNTYAKLIAAGAAVLVVAIGGYQFLPRESGPSGTNAPLSPRLPLLARGEFRLASEGRVSLRAVADGSNVAGRLFVGDERGTLLDVALQCTRTTEDGLIMIGGYHEDTDTNAAIVVKRGSPVQTAIWSPGSGQESQGANEPGEYPPSAHCLAFLDEQLVAQGGTDGVDLEPIEGWVELGVDANPLPAGLPLLARGNFVTVRGAVELEATGEGSSVTGRMTVSKDGGSFTVDLQCARTTEDGLIMIGGYTIDKAGHGGGREPEGTLAVIVLERGSPVRATVWSQRGGGDMAVNCLDYFERIADRLTDSILNDDDPNPIEGTVELGP